MELDVLVHKGNSGKPVVIFIHGLGMNKNFWTDPLGTKIFARNIPLRVFAATPPKPTPLKGGKMITIGSVPDKVDTLWTVLRDRGFNVLCWSQRRPVGPIAAAVEELDEVMHTARRLFPDKPIALIGHSRGGLIARKSMERKTPGVKALITISTPHGGSSLSRIGNKLSPLTAFLKGVLPKDTHGTVSGVIKNVTDLLEGNALKELVPGSEFFKGLKDVPSAGINYMSFGGTKTELLTLYRREKQGDKLYPKPFLKIPDSLIKIFPSSILPDELKPGKGDFMVTAESSVMPWAERHINLPVNHISIVWNKRVISSVKEVLDGI
jgi:pimeloyl-ACP methyl ester carboxylesterase